MPQHANYLGKYIINPYVTDQAGNTTSSVASVTIQRVGLPASNRQTIKDGTYQLVNGAAYNMDVHGGGSSNGTRVENYHHNGTPAQQFRFEYKGNGDYLIHPVCAPGKVVDVLRGNSWQDSIDQGDAIDIWEAGDYDAQLFKVIPVGNGQFALELSTKKNHVIGGKHNYAGTQLYLQEYTSYSASCKWKLTSVSGGAVDPCNHSYTNKVTKAATCTATGTRTYTCACGNTYAETIAATGHRSSGWIVGAAAKPGVAGYQYTKCQTCGKELKRETLPALKVPLTSFTLNKTSVSVNKGKTYTLKVSAYSPSNTTSSKTTSWKSSNTKVATVSSKGVVKGISTGTATITCTVAGVKKTCKVTVGVPLTSFKLNKTTASLAKGKSYTLKVTSYSPSNTTNSKTASWKSSNTKVATVSSKGVVKGLSTGTATITCTVAGVKKTCKVTIGVPMTSFKLNRTTASIVKGKSYTLKVTSYSPSKTTSSKTAKWSSSNTKVATVSSKGVIKGIGKGTATITCAVAGIKKTCKVTVSIPLTSFKLNKTTDSIAVGKSDTLKAGSFSPSDTTSSKTAKWSSSNTKVATVSSKGVVKGVSTGKATITCTVAGVKKTCKVTIGVPMTSFKLNRTTASIAKGKSYTLKVASYSPSNTTSSKTASWKSSNTRVATVSSKGVIKGVGKGTATITCTVAGIKKTCKVTVSIPLTSFKLNKTTAGIAKGKSYTLKAGSFSPSDTTSSKTAKWSSSNTKVATVSSKGVVKGISTGTATITCTVSGIKKTCKVTVKKAMLTEAQAKKIAYKHWNFKPGDRDDNQTGFLIVVFSDGLSEIKGKMYYRYRMAWRVEDSFGSHYSTIDYLYVDAYTGACHYSV